MHSLAGKLKRARAEYKDKSKQLQQKIASGLFGPASQSEKRGQKLAGEESLSAAGLDPSALATAPSSQADSNICRTLRSPVCKEDSASEGFQAGRVASAIATYSSSGMNSNVIFLLSTSLAVLIISAFFAYVYN